MTIYPVPKPQREPKRLPKPRTKSKRSAKSGGHLHPAGVSLSRRAFIRRERCIATGKKTGEWVTAEPWMPETLKQLCPYKARIVAAHVDSRGPGHPDAANMVPLEWMLHEWQGQIGWRSFAGRLRLMAPKEIARKFEARYQAAQANYERSQV
jgi:hypothetical protein